MLDHMIHASATALTSVLGAMLMITSCAPTSTPASLFNTRSLTGWSKAGGDATYRVDEATIVGTHGPGPNTFLCTNDVYEDFDLEFEFRWDAPINSGLQFRSHINDDGRVQGYQFEHDPSERSWTGGIYEEGGRGWLAPLGENDAARAAVQLDGWNRGRIEARGHHIRTWLNGVPCADLNDPDGPTSGFIALQVHGGQLGSIRWRNLVLTPVH